MSKCNSHNYDCIETRYVSLNSVFAESRIRIELIIIVIVVAINLSLVVASSKAKKIPGIIVKFLI